MWHLSDSDRLRTRVQLDAICAILMEIDHDMLSYILKDCSLATSQLTSNSMRQRLDQKGFWRVDKNKTPELRHTVLTQIAFQDLEDKITAAGDRDQGIEAFLAQNHGEGWMLPETLRLADYGLGHDDRAQQFQPVASRLGPRFYDWQLVQTAEESWRECHLHARNLLGADGYARLLSGADEEED